jgi:multidrug efflux pump subunit AcrA (membrane-fusion protein)
MNNIFKYLITILFMMLLGCTGDNIHSTSKTKNHIDHEKSQSEIYYTCSMHPKVHEEKPGKCPVCHMNLTKIEIENDDTEKSLEVNPIVQKDTWYCKDFPEVESEVKTVCPMDGTEMILKSKANKAAKIVAKVKLRKAQMGHFSPEYFPVTSMKMSKKIRLLGSVLQSEEKESNIPARIGGRVEKVYVKSTGSFVKKGDPVIDYYSPKLITAGEEYILARQSYLKTKSKEFKDMLRQSEQRLNLWGIRKSQYENWFKLKKVPRQITIHSEATGIIRHRFAFVGKYFKEGESYFHLADLSDVWVEMDVYEHDSSLIELAQKVELQFTAIPGITLVGMIDFINPVLDPKSRTLKVRATIENTLGKLKPGMIASAVLNIEIEGRPLVIPRTAIIDTGKRKVVWVKVNNKEFKAKVVQTGYESHGYVEVKEGLAEGESVVIEGSFLLDAQAQLFGGYEDIQDQAPIKHKH